MSIELPGGPYPATIDRGYWVWSRTIDNRLLAVQPRLLTVAMAGTRSVVEQWTGCVTTRASPCAPGRR